MNISHHHIFFTAFLFFSFLFSSTAQSFSVFGKVTDELDSAAVGAVAVLLKPQDSSVYKGTTTNTRGVFRVEGVNAGNYLLKVSFFGYKDVFKNVEVTDNLRAGKFKLQPLAKNLKEVEVKTSALLATQNGDTTSFNSNAYKTNKDAMAEDLITKMPGVTVVDGKVQAQGEDVKQILVDGKPFFGDDPNAVLKNIPAEIIDKVQVFDRRSDQSLFTGMDDGNSSKTINIITKVEFRNGLFGRVYGGYGYEDVYKGGGVFNHFKDKQRFTVMAMSNNINEQNFSSEDLLGVMSSSGNNAQRGGGMRGGGGRGGSSRGGGGSSGSDNFLVNARNGISTTHAFGLNFSDEWNKRTNVSFSYFFNLADNVAQSDLFRQYVVGSNNGLNYNENTLAQSDNMNHRLSGRLEHKLDSFNTILLQPKLSFQINNGTNTIYGVNSRTTIISSTNNQYQSKLNGYTISLPVLYNHSFHKRGRSLSINVSPSVNGSDGNSNYVSYNGYFIPVNFSDTIDQRSTLVKNGIISNGNVTYTEPLNTNNFLSFNYLITYNYSESDKITFNKNNSANDYSIKDSLVSNVFNTSYISNAAGIGYRYQKNNHSFSFGVNAQQAELNRQQIFPGDVTTGKTFRSLLPNAQYNYRLGNKHNFRINYRSSNNPPSVEQMQDVLNNSNVLQLSIGNPELRQNFQHNLFTRYSAVNTLKSTSLFVMLGGTYTNDYIGNSTIIASDDTTVFGKIFLAKGSQIIRPENMNNQYSLRCFFNYSFPVKFLKSNLNINGGANYNNTPALINGKINYARTTSPSMGLVLSSNVSENIDFTLSSSTAYNSVVNTLQSDLNSGFLSQNSRAKVNLTFLKKLVLSAEYNQQYFSGLTASYNQNINLLNAALAVKFLKGNSGELRLFVFDILNQNKSINRNITETYTEDTRTTILQRYFMLTFTYNFKTYFKSEGDKIKQQP